MLAAISRQDATTCLIWVVLAGVIFYLLNWLIGYVGIGEPFAKVARVVLGIAVVLVLINALLKFSGVDW